ncbi:MAG: hypothetical protein QM639_08345 [Rhodocyclaceae bacterium]
MYARFLLPTVTALGTAHAQAETAATPMASEAGTAILPAAVEPGALWLLLLGAAAYLFAAYRHNKDKPGSRRQR